MIPDEAVDAAVKIIYGDAQEGVTAEFKSFIRAKVRAALEAAAPYMPIHVHHHDIEHHARSFNEGYETAMAQELADDPATAQDWLDAKLAIAWDEGYTTGNAHNGRRDANPYREATRGDD